MKERDVVKKIRTEMQARLQTRLHKVHGSVYSEIGASDLYGTLPGGRAIYLEVKLPGKKLRPEQACWLEEEKKLGAIAECVDSWESIAAILSTFGYLTSPLR